MSPACRRHVLLAIAAVAAICAVSTAVAQQNAPAPAAGVPANARIAGQRRDIVLLGRQGRNVQYSFAEAPRVSITEAPERVEAVRIKLNVDNTLVNRAVASRDWRTMAQLLFPHVLPVLPFLDLPGNTATPVAFELGRALMKAGGESSGGGFTTEERARGANEFRAAYAVMTAVGRADWFDNSESARIRAALCLIMLGDLDRAAGLLDELGVPERTDDAYGVYWLTRGMLALARDETVAALDAAVESLLHETKDIDTFPDALLLAAHCRERLEDWHRARDIGYEVARLFENTPWQRVAVPRLRRIATEGLANAQEASRVENVFFGIDENMNTLVADYLERVGVPATGAEKPKENTEP